MNKKIIYANNYSYIRGGSEKVFFDEIELLEKCQWDVKSISVDDKGIMSPLGGRCELARSPKLYDHFLNLFWNRDAYKKLLALITNGYFKGGVLHCHNIYGRLSHSLLFAAKKMGMKTVITLHDMKYVCPHYTALNHGNLCSDCSNGRFYKAAVNKCHKDSFFYSALIAIEMYFIKVFGILDKVDVFISPSQFLIDYYSDNGFPYKIKYVPNFLPDGSKKSNETCNSSDYADCYLFVGRLSYEKGILTLIRAIRGTNRKLVIVGTGPLEGDIKSLISAYNLVDQVTMTGFLASEQVHDLVKGAKGLIVPSEWYENAPISILEALAYGKVVIASNIGGIPEMVHHKKNGFLFKYGDVDDLRDSLTQFESLSLEKKSRMQEYSLSLSATVFSEHSHRIALLEIYD